MTLRGEQPEWVPVYSFGPMPGQTRPCTSCMLEPLILSEFRFKGGGKDCWGVTYVPTKETGGALLPKPDEFILDDIRHWRDVIKAPSLDGVDWEAMAKKQLEGFYAMGVNREDTAIALNLHVGYFQNLMAFMGFTEGLCAMCEEPEEVLALFEYMCDFYTEVTRRIWPYVKPDVLTLMDDTAAWAAPFISREMYHDMVLPFHDRQAKFGRDAHYHAQLWKSRSLYGRSAWNWCQCLGSGTDLQRSERGSGKIWKQSGSHGMLGRKRTSSGTGCDGRRD